MFGTWGRKGEETGRCGIEDSRGVTEIWPGDSHQYPFLPTQTISHFSHSSLHFLSPSFLLTCIAHSSEGVARHSSSGSMAVVWHN